MNKQKIIGLIVGVVVFIFCIAGITYAYITWISNDIEKTVSSKCFNVHYDKGTNISGIISPSTDYTGGTSVTVKMDLSSECDIRANGKLYLNTSTSTTNSLFREGLLNYQVLINGAVTDLKGSIMETGDIVIDLGELSKNTSATTEYTVYVWIDYNLVENSDASSMYHGSIRAEAIQFE